MRRFALAVSLAVPFIAAPDGHSRRFPTTPGQSYAVTVSLPNPEITTRVTISDAQGVLAAKTLDSFDSDLSINLKPRAGPITITPTAETDIQIAPLNLTRETIALIPNQTWREAQQIELGDPIHASADDTPYSQLARRFNWFRVVSPTTQLVHFDLETPDRDVPPDVDIFQPSPDGDIEPYREGASAYTPEATQNFPGLSPFRTRILNAGRTYYIRVAANHPEFTLKTFVYPIPPYRDPHQAVQTGMDYLIALGDAWHANTPRRGAVASRTSMQHSETSACIACHPTQFTLRGYLTAVQNGYPIRHLSQLEFLANRLANNPRPLYGQPNVDWARVIFSARTVSSRVPVLLDMAHHATGENFGDTRGFANYLAKTDMADEPDGSLPFVSAFEIGLQSWQTFGLMHGTGRQREIEREILEREPKNIVDLAWKITALAQMHLPTEDLIAQLYSYQDNEGRFPYPFDRKSKPSDFITYQSLYALAIVGRRPESDPRLARTLAYALAHQRSDGSWQGDPVYKGFDTPFRDTQFAVMALSTLYPGAGKGTDHSVHACDPTAPQAAPAVDRAVCPLSGRRTESLNLLLDDLETPQPEQAIQKILESRFPLARASAARHLHAPDSIPALTHALADPSKIVQRAAAQSLRPIAVDHPREVSESLQAALAGQNPRARWGALRVFAQEFRALTNQPQLLAAIESAVADPLPSNRFAAANALWRWSQWTRDPFILDALAQRLAAEPNDTVRRGLIESIYNTLDENNGQLEAWIRALSNSEDRARAEAAFHGYIAEQSRILARNLEGGNRRLRLGLLNALWDFHLRHAAIPENSRGKTDVILGSFLSDYSAGVPRLHDPDFVYEPYAEASAFHYSPENQMHVTRLGNDADIPHLFSDSGPQFERALLKCLDGADREMTLEVIKAGSYLAEAATPAFTRAMLNLITSPDPEIRAAVKRAPLTLGSPDQPDHALQQHLTALIDSRNPDALEAILPLLMNLPIGSAFTRDANLAWSIEKLLHEDQVSADALRAAAVFPSIGDMPLMRLEILHALKSENRETRFAALDLVLARYITDPTTNELSRQFIAAMRPTDRAAFLDKLDPSKFALRLSAASAYRAATGGDPLPADDNLFSSPIVQELVTESLTSSDAQQREAARDLVREQPKLGKIDPSPRVAPDFEFFRTRIEPILEKPGADGKACIVCHSTHAIFKLSRDARANYSYALKVIDTAQPRHSLMLIKPTHPNDATGDATLYLSTHNGGERWRGNENSIEYQTILHWIRGEKLQ